MSKELQSTDKIILRSLRSRRSAAVFSPRHFDKLGSPAAVRQALSRLAGSGKIRRIRRGLYDLPRTHPVIGQAVPDTMAAVRTLMEGSHAQWQASGAYAANLLGLSDQVPAKIVILTDGVPRRISLGKLTLIFRRAAPRNLLGAGRPTGLVIQALRYFGRNAVSAEIVQRLRKQLDKNTKADLRSLTPKLPAWMRPIVEQVTKG
jgi:predicted transcriptional regulator of viral defense system